MSSSEDRIAINGSEGNSVATPSTSFGSKTGQSKEEKSQITTSVPELASSNFITNKDEVDRCDHRLKLHFAMDLFKDDNEDFRCMIQVCDPNFLLHYSDFVETFLSFMFYMIYYLLFIIYYLLFIIYYLLFIIYYLLFIIYSTCTPYSWL